MYGTYAALWDINNFFILKDSHLFAHFAYFSWKQNLWEKNILIKVKMQKKGKRSRKWVKRTTVRKRGRG